MLLPPLPLPLLLLVLEGGRLVARGEVQQRKSTAARCVQGRRMYGCACGLSMGLRFWGGVMQEGCMSGAQDLLMLMVVVLSVEEVGNKRLMPTVGV
jgi:hypothetical protein